MLKCAIIFQEPLSLSKLRTYFSCTLYGIEFVGTNLCNLVFVIRCLAIYKLYSKIIQFIELIVLLIGSIKHMFLSQETVGIR